MTRNASGKPAKPAYTVVTIPFGTLPHQVIDPSGKAVSAFRTREQAERAAEALSK